MVFYWQNLTRISVFILLFSSLVLSITANDDVTPLIRFELFTKEVSNISVPIPTASRSSEFERYFQSTIQTKMLIHGWTGDTSNKFITKVKAAYLANRDCNVIAVSWPSKSLYYPSVAEHTEVVGTAIAVLIDYLHDCLGMDMQLLHIIGHSLGAHVAGFAGDKCKYRVSRISALDPALPDFNPKLHTKDQRLDAGDADFVDVIHTGDGLYGIREPIGTVDFYPNGGKIGQPGCGLRIPCSHVRSVEYFHESIQSTKGFWGHPCESWWKFTRGWCPDATVLMGDPVPMDARGNMYLETNSDSPYALGRV